MREEIHHAIADGRLPPGTRLPEEHVAEVFGVSRARARVALQELAHDKVVVLEPNRGAFVAKPSPEEARQIFAARRLIEVALAPAVVDSLDEAALAHLRAHVTLERETELAPNRYRGLKTSHDFHMQVARLAGNSVVEGFLAELLVRSALVTAIYERPGVEHCSHAIHAHLVDILERRDADAFGAALAEHLDEIETHLDLVEPVEREVDLKTLFRSPRG
ncbi:GntR family transcriptional regulator [Acuticoccus sp. 2012]|uniref:GntR family transcriptional regulator n=1 Tax=Acuticoccus mangrovi TaxID=2796142 RepID=A0A934IU08_9HYPH|nr:GntR family transcriptional regulator [Acuticoccus mangrovi]